MNQNATQMVQAWPKIRKSNLNRVQSKVTVVTHLCQSNGGSVHKTLKIF